MRTKSPKQVTFAFAFAFAQLVVEPDGRRLLGRFGSSPAGLPDRYRELVKTPRGLSLNEFGAAIQRNDRVLLVWTLSPEKGTCGLWARFFDEEGRPASQASCIAGSGASSPLVTTTPDGHFLFAWRRTSKRFPGSEQVWVGGVEMHPTP